MMFTLTLLVYGHHHGPVLGVDVEQDGGSHQVLWQVAQQRHCPVNAMDPHSVRHSQCRCMCVCINQGGLPDQNKQTCFNENLSSVYIPALRT